MASNIDPTVFPDNAPVEKSDLRNQFQIAKDEITALQGTATATTTMTLQAQIADLQSRVSKLENP